MYLKFITFAFKFQIIWNDYYPAVANSNVACLEFGIQKNKIDKILKK